MIGTDMLSAIVVLTLCVSGGGGGGDVRVSEGQARRVMSSVCNVPCAYFWRIEVSRASP
jgi:hypothetical protein